MPIYEPREDSYLLQDTLKNYLLNKNKSMKILDMGSGSGIIALTCINLGFENVTTADIDEDSINRLRKLKIKTVQSDLFSNIKEKFDLIIFNPPYLPEDKQEPEDTKIHTTAGKKGYELIIKFLEEVREYLKWNGKILLLFSSLSKPAVIKKKAKEISYRLRLLNKKKLFFEELYVYEFKKV